MTDTTHTQIPMPSDDAGYRSGWSLFAESSNKFLELKLNKFSFGLTMFLIVLAIFAPWIAPFPYDVVDPARGLSAPGWPHLMGTDQAGRDIFSRVLYGAQTSLSI